MGSLKNTFCAVWPEWRCCTEGEIVPGRTARDGLRVHHATQNGTQFKTYELFISGIFQLIFLGRGGPWVTEAVKSGPAGRAAAVSPFSRPVGRQAACPRAQGRRQNRDGTQASWLHGLRSQPLPKLQCRCSASAFSKMSHFTLLKWYTVHCFCFPGWALCGGWD